MSVGVTGLGDEARRRWEEPVLEGPQPLANLLPESQKVCVRGKKKKKKKE